MDARSLAIAEAIRGYTAREELVWLFETARALPVGAWWAEIGCGAGRSAMATALGLRARSRLVLCDDWSGPAAREIPDPVGQIHTAMNIMSLENPDVRIELRVGKSSEVARQFNDAVFDVVFIDGDDSEAGVRRDIAAWRPKVKPAGLLCGVAVDVVPELLPGWQLIPRTRLWAWRAPAEGSAL